MIMINNNKKVAIVIVSYNSSSKLEACLTSLKKQTYPWELVDLILVDNNSLDDSIKIAIRHFPSIRIIKNSENQGFAKANNQAYELAKTLQVDYLVLLNDDTIVTPQWLDYLIETAESNQQIAAVQAKLMLWPEKDLINSLGNALTFLGFGYCNYYRRPYSPILKSLELPYPSGAAVAIKMIVLEKAGLFDEIFFMYHEDVDLGWRLRLLGFKIILEPKSIVYHQYNFSKADYKYYYMERNRLWVYGKNYKLPTLIIFLPTFLLMELGIIFFAWRHHWLKYKLTGYWWLIKNWRRLLIERWKIKKMRQVSDREILKLLVAEIKFQEVDNFLLNRIVNPLMTIYLWVAKQIIFW